jgi:hypothetical protein
LSFLLKQFVSSPVPLETTRPIFDIDLVSQTGELMIVQGLGGLLGPTASTGDPILLLSFMIRYSTGFVICGHPIIAVGVRSAASAVNLSISDFIRTITALGKSAA